MNTFIVFNEIFNQAIASYKSQQKNNAQFVTNIWLLSLKSSTVVTEIDSPLKQR